MLRTGLFFVSAFLGGCAGAWGGFWLLFWAQYGWQYFTHTLPEDDLTGGFVGLPGIPLGFILGVLVAVWIVTWTGSKQHLKRKIHGEC